ncbi:hypothetical protein [Vulcaniibacterium gelatinicum]|nr:hypothetical protein [Vulcaniibacterium gelatinicum]
MTALPLLLLALLVLGAVGALMLWHALIAAALRALRCAGRRDRG